MVRKASTSPRPRFASPLGGALLAAWALAGPAGAAESPPAPGAKPPGEACIECHEDEVNALRRTQHGKEAFRRLSPDGCETCHGASAEHVAHPNDRKLFPRTPSKLAVDEQVETCRGCHDGGKQSMWTGSAHDQRGLSCLDCHAVHGFESDSGQLKKAMQMETCFRCHADVRAETRKTSHHPVREGKIACTDCHNPHGTQTPKMIAAASVNDQCYSCHTEKRGPFLWEHAPVRESCLNCHAPHGSNHQKLQVTSTPYLCQQCHSNTRHPGTLYDATALPGAARQSNRIFNRSCANCHANIHGSNHPSGPYLGR
jgi:DmsE family decaheme c-type cytochrome